MTVNEIGWYDEREDKILFVNGTPVGNPPTGHIWLYADAAGTLYTRTSAGVDTAVGTGGAGGDAADITYTPAVLTDWDGDADPGDVDGALDQLAERTDDLEATSHAAITLSAEAGAVLGLTGQLLDLDTQTANLVFAGPTTGAAAKPTLRALVAADMPAAYLPLAGGTMAGTLALADNLITRPVIKDYGETVNPIGAVGGGSQDIDLESGNVVTATVDTSETTFTFSNPPASGTAGSFTLILTNGGSQTVNWPGSVKWAGGTAPVLTAAGVDILTFVTVDAGTNWYGFAAGLDMS